MKTYRKKVLEEATRKQGLTKGRISVKELNQNKILTILAKQPLNLSKLQQETNLSRMGLFRNLRELEMSGYIKITRDRNGKRVYEIQKIPNVEELIVEALMKHLGHLIAFRLLEASVRGEKKVHVEEFFDVEGFLGNFLEEKFPRFRDTGFKALLERLKEKYGEPTL